MGLGRDILYGLGAAVTSPLWGLALLRTGKWRTDWAGKFGRPPEAAISMPKQSATAPSENTPSSGGRLLIHAVSVGEINATRPLVDWFQTHHPDVDIVVATTTNTGFARAQTLYAEKLAGRVVRYPLDFSFAVGRFLDRVKPTVVALMELEVWPNFMDGCTQRDIPVAVINGRLTARSYRGYRKALPLIRPAFAQLAHAGVQASEHVERFAGVGVAPDKIKVMDSMKWEGAAALTPDVQTRAQALAHDLGLDLNQPVVVAGSTAPGEDELLIEALSAWPQGTQLILAPRKPEWFDHVAGLHPNIVRRSQIEHQKSKIENPPIFLLDTIGELRDAYALADVCIVGRSFTGQLYGSDLMEPIALGKATIIGPHHSDFQDAVDTFAQADATVITSDPKTAVADLLDHPSRREQLAANGLKIIAQRRGAAERYGQLLLKLLNND